MDPKVPAEEVAYRSFMPQFTAEGMDQNQPIIDLVVKLALEKNCTPAQIALAWTLAEKPFIVPIPGTRKSKRLIENMGAAEVEITPEELALINKTLDELPAPAVYQGKHR